MDAGRGKKILFASHERVHEWAWQREDLALRPVAVADALRRLSGRSGPHA